MPILLVRAPPKQRHPSPNNCHQAQSSSRSSVSEASLRVQAFGKPLVRGIAAREVELLTSLAAHPVGNVDSQIIRARLGSTARCFINAAYTSAAVFNFAARGHKEEETVSSWTFLPDANTQLLPAKATPQRERPCLNCVGTSTSASARKPSDKGRRRLSGRSQNLAWTRTRFSSAPRNFRSTPVSYRLSKA